jgi:hypothetical protein
MTALRFGLSSKSVILVALAAGACERRVEPQKEPVPKPSEPVPQALGPSEESLRAKPGHDKSGAPKAAGDTVSESAVSALARARCDREERCDNVGNGKKYASRGECLSETRSDWRDDLNARECPEGVSSSQLAHCVDEIKRESCGNPVEKLESVLACRTADLCKRS